MPKKPVQLTAPLKFLIVDDSRAIQAILRRTILNCGYAPVEIKTAIDGEVALDLIDSFNPDLVVTDWHMPKVSGLEMLQALRQMGHQHVRVGFVTTEKSVALLDEAVSNGAMFILHKPFDDAALIDAVTIAVKDMIQQRGGAVVAAPEPVAEPPQEVKATVDPVPPSASKEPVQAEAMQSVLATCLGNIPFRLIAREAMVLDKLTPSNLLGLYAATGRNGVYAIGVMDANAVCIVGGGSARKSPPDVRAAMAAGKPDDVMMSKAHEFLRSISTCMTQSHGVPGVAVSLAKASIVKSSFAKLAEVLTQTQGRSDFRLSVPGYGEGRMAFFVMTA